MCFYIETPNLHLEKVSRIHKKCSIHFLKKTHFLWLLLRFRKSIPPRSRTSLAQGSFLGSTEGSLGNVRRRQRRPHWEGGGLTNSRLWGRLMVNTHLFLAYKYHCEYSWYFIYFHMFIKDLEDSELPFPWFHGTTYLLTDMLASNGSPIGPTSLKTCVVNGMVSNTKPVRY